MIVFLHINKTAGSTLQFVLENNFGISACHTNHTKRPVFAQKDFEFARKFFPFMKSVAGHNLIDPLSLDVPSPFHITFLRDPIARVFSNYQGTILKGENRLTFEESMQKYGFLKNQHVKLMAGGENLDKAKRYLERCDFVGLTEKFDLSLHVLGKLCPYPLNLKYKRRRVATSNHIRKPLLEDSRMVELARHYNQLDIQLYDFAVKEIFPRICERAGFKPDDSVPSFDEYTTDFHWRYRLCHLYNLLIFRQSGKLRPR